MALDNQMLIEGQRKLLDSFIQLIAGAIDEKSPYTGGHCERVPMLTEMLAAAACEASEGQVQGFPAQQTKRMYELHIAGWMHDCGKVTTPEYVVDKSTKLETIYDRIETVITRFEIIKRDVETRVSASDLATNGIDKAAAQGRVPKNETAQLGVRLRIPHGSQCRRRIHGRRQEGPGAPHRRNVGGAAPTAKRSPSSTTTRSTNLCIGRGTLTAEERKVINDHIVVTIEMLEKLPFPKGP